MIHVTVLLLVLLALSVCEHPVLFVSHAQPMEVEDNDEATSKPRLGPLSRAKRTLASSIEGLRKKVMNGVILILSLWCIVRNNGVMCAL